MRAPLERAARSAYTLDMPYIPLRPELVGITSLLDYRPETAAPLCELTDVLLRGPSTLTEVERELIATSVSQRNECSYCASAHAAAACALPGGSTAQVAGLSAAAGPFSPKLSALLRIAALVQESGRAVTSDDVSAARACGATDREVHDTVLIAALFCLYNRYVDGLAAVTPDDPSYYEALGARLSARGYRMPSDGYHPLATGASAVPAAPESAGDATAPA